MQYKKQDMLEMISEESVKLEILKLVNPVTGTQFGEYGERVTVEIGESEINVGITVGYPVKTMLPDLNKTIEKGLAALKIDRQTQVSCETKIVAHAAQSGVKLLPNVRNVIAIASGKGGVGKSTTTANLAIALADEGARVGILDADIYGPSQQMMLGMEGRPESPDGKRISPMVRHGVQAMSIGALVDVDQPMVWRGPMVTQALEQLLRDTDWSDLDYLLIDLPPGTGDIQLTLSQKVPLTGALIVTTPQDIALIDARKALKMFEKVNVPILGVVENMSVHVCSKCGHAEHIFGEGGGAKMATDYDIEVLGSLPLDMSIRQGLDEGRPSVVADPDNTIGKIYSSVARKISMNIAKRKRDYSQSFPNISVQNN